MSTVPAPKRGEIWLVDFDPAVGTEIRKTRPALVMSRDDIGNLPLRVVVPITDWKPIFVNFQWFVDMGDFWGMGLLKHSGADAFQTKSLSLKRFARQLGTAEPSLVEEVALAISDCVGAA